MQGSLGGTGSHLPAALRLAGRLPMFMRPSSETGVAARKNSMKRGSPRTTCPVRVARHLRARGGTVQVWLASLQDYAGPKAKDFCALQQIKQHLRPREQQLTASTG